jgi:hypothetical protein
MESTSPRDHWYRSSVWGNEVRVQAIYSAQRDEDGAAPLARQTQARSWPAVFGRGGPARGRRPPPTGSAGVV